MANCNDKVLVCGYLLNGPCHTLHCRLKQEFPDRVLIASIMEEYNKGAWEEIIGRWGGVGASHSLHLPGCLLALVLPSMRNFRTPASGRVVVLVL
jgi:hypothetical protein